MQDSHREPEDGFSIFKLHSTLQRGIRAAGFTEPRPIQTQAIPAALEGRDILGLAQTGTGKTAAFALPVIERLLAGSGGTSPRVLIIAPTRELAGQISAEIATLARFTSIKIATIFGGVSFNTQKAALKRRPEIVVACPGRLLDLVQQGAVRLDRVETLVLDEADHMFDMGFLPDIRRIIAALPERRQNLLFSATMPKEIRRLANQLLDNPHVVELSHTRPLETIEHALYPVNERDKIDVLRHVLAGDDFVSAIVFTRTKHRAKRLAEKLDRSGHRAVALQGNMSQGQRVRAMAGFRNRSVDVLVATDIAARGIDVEQVSHVVNFDMPNTSDAYTHRIGRTGRSEREGKAYTLVTDADHLMIREVERRIGASIPRRQVNGIERSSMPLQPGSAGGTGSGRSGSARAGSGSGRAGSGSGRAGSRRSGARRANAAGSRAGGGGSGSSNPRSRRRRRSGGSTSSGRGRASRV